MCVCLTILDCTIVGVFWPRNCKHPPVTENHLQQSVSSLTLSQVSNDTFLARFRSKLKFDDPQWLYLEKTRLSARKHDFECVNLPVYVGGEKGGDCCWCSLDLLCVLRCAGCAISYGHYVVPDSWVNSWLQQHFVTIAVGNSLFCTSLSCYSR